MKEGTTTKTFEWLAGTKYKAAIHHGSNIIEIFELVKTSWVKRIFSSQDKVWKRIYFGHLTPLESIVKFYKSEVYKR